MSGAFIALLSGVGFGLFQTVNRRTVQAMEVYLSTFLLLVVSTIVLAAIAVLTEDLRMLEATPRPALLSFALAAFVHFFVGWTLLNASQKRVGAARTSLMIGTVPLFGTMSAALALRELPTLPVLIGMILVVFGVLYLSAEPAAVEEGQGERGPEHWVPEPGWRGLMFGLGAALCWSLSPIFIKQGLRGLPSPLLGLTVGLVPCVIAYGLGILVRAGSASGPVSRRILVLKVVAGALVGLSQWGRWAALKIAPVSVVLSLTQITVLVVIVLSPLVLGRHLERVTPRVWVGGAVIVGGTLLLVWSQ